MSVLDSDLAMLATRLFGLKLKQVEIPYDKVVKLILLEFGAQKMRSTSLKASSSIQEIRYSLLRPQQILILKNDTISCQG
ncbi:hypothetical protein DV515_00004451 [Chloebia gouldiae]|uniref:Uncharacterized protein n=1 Tax=Chloebia gouldiae TaxID=44316 RepID=A0A3L8SQR7_CHLGU|nr:hypothetical protein DV515_00004451 [Chloebia gouldiae]